ncbi:MAG: DUF3817 domain-containing protein [Saprospiraceae bacterium]|nr:DUF3817 domain-containing protein [Saprospiraceae bacterium]
MSQFRFFRYIAILEGISYLLFGLTMPLKYMYGILEPNFYVGMAHGLLFLLYCVLGLRCAIHYKWTFGFSVMVFLASLVPFGTFYLMGCHASFTTLLIKIIGIMTLFRFSNFSQFDPLNLVESGMGYQILKITKMNM